MNWIKAFEKFWRDRKQNINIHFSNFSNVDICQSLDSSHNPQPTMKANVLMASNVEASTRSRQTKALLV